MKIRKGLGGQIFIKLKTYYFSKETKRQKTFSLGSLCQNFLKILGLSFFSEIFVWIFLPTCEYRSLVYV